MDKMPQVSQAKEGVEMDEKWKQDIIQEGKKRMLELLSPRPSPGTLSTRMFDFVDWFGERVLNLTEEHYKDHKIVHGKAIHQLNININERDRQISRLKSELENTQKIKTQIFEEAVNDKVERERTKFRKKLEERNIWNKGELIKWLKERDP